MIVDGIAAVTFSMFLVKRSSVGLAFRNSSLGRSKVSMVMYLRGSGVRNPWAKIFTTANPRLLPPSSYFRIRLAIHLVMFGTNQGYRLCGREEMIQTQVGISFALFTYAKTVLGG